MYVFTAAHLYKRLKSVFISAGLNLRRMAGNANGIGDVQVRNVGNYVVKNFRFSSIPSAVGRFASNYRARYVTCKNARMTPFFHVVGVAMFLNYLIDYKYHLKHEKLRKYH